MRIVRLLIDLIPVEGTPPQQGTLLLRRMELDGPREWRAAELDGTVVLQQDVRYTLGSTGGVHQAGGR